MKRPVLHEGPNGQFTMQAGACAAQHAGHIVQRAIRVALLLQQVESEICVSCRIAWLWLGHEYWQGMRCQMLQAMMSTFNAPPQTA